MERSIKRYHSVYWYFLMKILSLVSLDFLVILFMVVIPDFFLMPKSYRWNFILPTV